MSGMSGKFDPSATKAWTITLKKGQTARETLIHSRKDTDEVYAFEVLFITHIAVGEAPASSAKNQAVVVKFRLSQDKGVLCTLRPGKVDQVTTDVMIDGDVDLHHTGDCDVQLFGLKTLIMLDEDPDLESEDDADDADADMDDEELLAQVQEEDDEDDEEVDEEEDEEDDEEEDEEDPQGGPLMVKGKQIQALKNNVPAQVAADDDEADEDEDDEDDELDDEEGDELDEDDEEEIPDTEDDEDEEVAEKDALGAAGLANKKSKLTQSQVAALKAAWDAQQADEDDEDEDDEDDTDDEEDDEEEDEEDEEAAQTLLGKRGATTPSSAPVKKSKSMAGTPTNTATPQGATEKYIRELKSELKKGPRTPAQLGMAVKRPDGAPKLNSVVKSNPNIFNVIKGQISLVK